MKEKNGQHTPVLQIRCFAKTIKMEEMETFLITLRQCVSQNKLAFTTVQNSPEGKNMGRQRQNGLRYSILTSLYKAMLGVL